MQSEGSCSRPCQLVSGHRATSQACRHDLDLHFKSLWLHHVDLFLQSAIEIGMRNVHRAKLKVFQGSSSKNNANGGIVNSSSKSLLEIKARVLRLYSPWQPTWPCTLSREPSALCLTFMNHLEPIAHFPGGNLTISQVPLSLEPPSLPHKPSATYLHESIAENV